MLHALVLLASLALPGDWPQWRGPDQTGLSSESGWLAEGRPAWRAELGLGYSCVSIADGWLYTKSTQRQPARPRSAWAISASRATSPPRCPGGA